MQSTLFICLLLAVWFIITIILVSADIRTHKIPRLLNLVGVFFATILGWQIHGLFVAVLGGVLATLFLGLAYGLGFVYQRYRPGSKELNGVEAFGFGDVIFGVGLGFLLGEHLAIQGLFLGMILAGLVGITCLLFLRMKHRYRPEMGLPLTPFLMSGSLLSFLASVYPK